MSAAVVLSVASGSPAARAGILAGDRLERIAGAELRDVIQYQLEADEPEVRLELDRDGESVAVVVRKGAGEPLGLDLDSAVFDRVRTCDNHCEFCFIYQLPKGMRRSLYLKDDDYRLSFLYGNFTTLTRFTEADLERVVTERLSPLYVSIHATDPQRRAELLRNPRGATSLRWLRALLDHGITVHGQVVVCPGFNDGRVLEETLCGVADEYPELATLAVVPLGVSAHNTEARMRPHTRAEAEAVLEAVAWWQDTFRSVLGRRLVYAADEYYLLAGRAFPPLVDYEGCEMHEDGIGMAASFAAEFRGTGADVPSGPKAGFFAWADGAVPANPTGYRLAGARSAPAAGTEVPGGSGGGTAVRLGPRRGAPVAVLSGAYGARVLGPLIGELGRDDVRVLTVENRFFGGNVAVAGLMVGADVAAALDAEPAGDRYLLPDVCLSNGRFLDGVTPAGLPRPVEVVPTDGAALRRALER
ncbi:MAG: DUF512 domain-containing protein [Acidimicrobiia bacterium]|nr:DUF512 domain-containing protein [Acidimicrobiia bacterium]